MSFPSQLRVFPVFMCVVFPAPNMKQAMPNAFDCFANQQ